MGIKPLGGEPYVPPTADTMESRLGEYTSELEETGEKVGEGLAAVDAKASSANSGVTDLANRVAALEATDLATLPLVLFWNGSGTKPTLKPAWGLLNTSTGEFEKGA